MTNSSATSPMNIGIVGCGNISGIYFDAGSKFDVLNIVACADIDMDRARSKAEEKQVRALTVDEMLADQTVDIVVNLTIPAAHAEVAVAALEAGKHVYSEKPLGLDQEEGNRVLALANQKGLRVGNAPDTFLGGGIQTCHKLIDEGAIGKPLGSVAFMHTPGHERWHPNPDFYYKRGGGPMFDMGPYYLTALISLMGPVSRVTGSTQTTYPQRTISSQPRAGEVVDVEIPTYVTGLLDFEAGAVGTIITSFDTWASTLPRIEIYGTQGSLVVPDPNTFGGPVKLKRSTDDDWQEVEIEHHYTENSRGLGVADMATAIQSGRPHRASGELANHVLEIMCAIHDASEEGRHIELSSSCERPAALPIGMKNGVLDL